MLTHELPAAKNRMLADKAPCRAGCQLNSLVRREEAATVTAPTNRCDRRRCDGCGSFEVLRVDTLSITTQSGNEKMVATLVGNYAERCINHGRKFYEKIGKIEGHAGMKVFLYF